MICFRSELLFGINTGKILKPEHAACKLLGHQLTHMMPSTFQLSFCSSSQPVCNHKLFQYYPQVRSQSFKDRANIVDGNLNILRDRIEELKRKETRLTCSTTATQQLLKREWCYGAGYDHRHKRDAMFLESIELMALASGACGLVFLTGSFSICLVSLLLHLFQH